MRKSTLMVAGLFTLTFILWVIWLIRPPVDTVRHYPQTEYASDPVPDFSQFEQTAEKKQAFFDYLKPAVEAHNQYLLSVREKLIFWQTKLSNQETLSEFESSELEFLVNEYKVDKNQSAQGRIATLLHKVDVIPLELVLIQSANESAWGTSRFAQQGYNFFGQWCFVRDCGFVPKQRNQGAIHEVARFDDLDSALYSYMRNLNRHPAYAELRRIRARLRETGQEITGSKLAEGLLEYSERREEYVEELQQMMRINERFIES